MSNPPPLQGSDTPERCADVTWDMRGHGAGQPSYEANVGDLVWNPKGGEGHVLVAEAQCGEKHNGRTVDCGCGGWLDAYGGGPCTSTVRICECGEDDSWRDHHYEVLRMATPVIPPRSHDSGSVCGPCQEFRRGERENLTIWGVSVHVCEHKRDGGHWGFDACPCGCAERKPGQLDQDRSLYGNAFIGSRGERIDPSKVSADRAAPREERPDG